MKLIEYIKDVKAELKHVSWPTKKQSLIFAVIVIIISVATSFYLGFFDFIFTKLLQNFVI
ncbi:preprotein translocase subunit SecE [Candidatus Nomurabacteria bacterium]|nr:preprotein translocase subunit SecE [Candidatus Nomurabacteria bacterium]